MCSIKITAMNRRKNLRRERYQTVLAGRIQRTLLTLAFLFSFDICAFYELTETRYNPCFVTARSSPLNTGTTGNLESQTRRRLLFESSLKRHYDISSSGVLDTANEAVDDEEKKMRLPCAFYKPYRSRTPTILDFDFVKIHWVYRLCPDNSMTKLRLEIASMPSDPDADIISFGNIQFNITGSYNLGSDSSPHLPLPQHILHSKSSDENQGQRIDYYYRGDTCQVSAEDVGGQLRSKTTKVVHENQCCWETSDFDGSLQTQNQEHKSRSRIMDVEEQSECTYVVRLCSICPALERDEGTTRMGKNDWNVGQGTNDAFGSGINHQQSNDEIEEEGKSEQLKLIDVYLQTFNNKSIKRRTDEHPLSEGLQNVDPGNFPPMPPSKIASNRDLAKSMFQHGYDSYMYNAYPASELKPVSCRPGSFNLVRLPALTLIDSLDTLLIMRNHTEFARGVERLRLLDNVMKASKVKEKGDDPRNNRNPHATLNGFNGITGGLFAVNQNVSVFETNIRVLGGLLSAHQMAMAWMNETALVEDILHEDGSVLIGEIQKKWSREKLGKYTCKQNMGQFEMREMASKQTDAQEFEPILPEVCHQTGVTQLCEGSLNNFTKINSGHTQSWNTVCAPPAYWNYDGILLSLAHDIGKRLLPAFNTETGIPYGTVNLLHGIPYDETTVASLAGAGTLSIEMELLSRLTGDTSFGKAAKLASRALWARRSSINLVGKHIDVHTGAWIEHLSGIGSNSDSFYEYLVKHYFLFPEDEEFWVMFQNMYSGIFNEARLGDWYVDVDMNTGYVQRQAFESLAAFYPGMQVLLGEFMSSSRTTNSIASVREYTALLPERFDFLGWKLFNSGATHPLRPELHESTYFLHAAMKDLPAARSDTSSNETVSSSGWLWSADFSLHAIEQLTKTECGYGVFRTVNPQDMTDFVHDTGNLDDEMPSFFLSETLKYLFLSFDSSNVLLSDKEREWIFTTEAHPVHHVPPPNSYSVNSTDDKNQIENHDVRLSNMKKRVLNILKDRRIPISSIDISTDFNYLKGEKWTRATPCKEYTSDVQNISTTFDEKKLIRPNYFDLFGRIMGSSEMYKDELLANFATLSHSERGKGDGDRLSKTCPSHSNPNGLWVEALGGHELDYTDFFLSYTDDDVNDSTAENAAAQMPSALIASALFGTNYMSKKISRSSCSISERNESWLKQNVASQYTSRQSPNQTPTQSHRLDGGTKLGSFDVSIFDQNTGFFVKHKNSGESIEVTIFSDEKDDLGNNKGRSFNDGNGDSTVLTVDSYYPTISKENKKDGLLQSLLGFSMPKILLSTHGRRQGIKKSPQNGYQRSVLVSDLDGHAFVCEVELKIPLGSSNHSKRRKSGILESSGTPQHYETVATYPCLGAMYGRTQMKHLIGTGGLEVEAVLRNPDKLDECGCGKSLSGEEQNEGNSPFIQLARRGECTFRHKALHQMEHNSYAEAVIIINSEPDKIFLMVGHEDEEVLAHTAEDEPVSVLVSKRDGDSMIHMVKKYEKIQAVVRISEQEKYTDEALNNIVKWPVVNTSSDSKKIQILASSGWGVLALENSDAKTDWQIMILEHSFNDNK